MYVFRGLTLRRVLWRMTCSRGLLIQHRCLSMAASSVCNTRPGLGEALGAALQRGCKAEKKRTKCLSNQLTDNEWSFNGH